MSTQCFVCPHCGEVLAYIQMCTDGRRIQIADGYRRQDDGAFKFIGKNEPILHEPRNKRERRLAKRLDEIARAKGWAGAPVEMVATVAVSVLKDSQLPVEINCGSCEKCVTLRIS